MLVWLQDRHEALFHGLQALKEAGEVELEQLFIELLVLHELAYSHLQQEHEVKDGRLVAVSSEGLGVLSCLLEILVRFLWLICELPRICLQTLEGFFAPPRTHRSLFYHQ